ncbi:putative integral membrane protein [Diplodia seriata]|uniref:Putative integral membrane protein n=1 Tax=Diplodia seriata TaxID=420778 RepID=A0A0G2E3K5_9PEZI|nr:putative integral membrane protein [Diplodia seriata]
MTELRPIAVQTIAAGIAGCVCSFTVLMLKFLSRYRSKSAFGLDDVLVAVAWTITIPLTVSFYIQGKNGMAYSMNEIPLDVYLTGRQWFWASSWMYYLALGLSKLSVTVQFLRIFITPKTLLVSKCTIAFVVSWTIISVCVGAFECVPVARYWDKTIAGKCINGADTFLANACMNILTDFVIIGIPVPSLLKLQVGPAKKMGLLFAFSLGLVVCAISVARIPMVTLAFAAGKPGNLSLMLWSTVELHVSIACACLPSIRPLFVSFLRFAGIDSYLKSSTKSASGPRKSQYYGGGRNGTGGSAVVSAAGRGKVEYIGWSEAMLSSSFLIVPIISPDVAAWP